MATMNDLFSHIYTTEANLNSVPIKKGQIIACTDSEKLYVDTADKRVDFSDIISVDNYTALPLAPLDKFYKTTDTGKLYYHTDSGWHVISELETSSSAEDIDNAVALAHSHDNKTSLDRLGVTADNQLTIDGLVFDLPESGIPCYLQTVNENDKSATCILLQRNAQNSGWEPYGDVTSCWLWWEGETEFPISGMTGYAPLREDHWENVVKELGVDPSCSNGAIFEDDDKFGRVVRCGATKYFDDGLEHNVNLGNDRLWFPPDNSNGSTDYLIGGFTYSIWFKPLQNTTGGLTSFYRGGTSTGGGMYYEQESRGIYPCWLSWYAGQWGAAATNSGAGNRYDAYYTPYTTDNPPWIMATIVIGNGFVSMYVNGQLGFQSGSQTEDINQLRKLGLQYQRDGVSNPLMLGMNWQRTAAGNTLFANAVGYNRALSAQEVLKLYNYQNAGNIPGVVTQPSLPKVGQAGVLVGDVFIPLEDNASKESLTLLQEEVNQNKSDIATLTSDLANTVKTINGIAPNGSGEVTIPTASSDTNGLMSSTDKTKLDSLSTGSSEINLTVGNGLSGDGTESTPLTLDLSNYSQNASIKFTSTAGAVDLISNTMEVALYSGTAHVKANVDSVELQGTNLKFNNNAQNTAGGIVVIDKESGKIPASIVPATSGSVDLSAYNGLVGITTTGVSSISNGASGNYKFTLGITSNGVILTEDGSTRSITVRSMERIHLDGGKIDISGSSVGILSAGKLDLASSQGNIILDAQDSVDANIEMHGTGILWNGAALNTANGLVTLNGSGKIPVSLYDVTVDLTDYSVSENISIRTTGSSSTLTLDGKTINIGNPNANQVFIQGLGVSLKCGEDSVYISGGTATTTIVATEKFYVNCPGEFESVNFLSNVQINNHDLNTAQGLVQLDANGKVPESLLPEIGNASWTKVTLNQADFATEDITYGGSYKELDGICSVEVYDADGYKVEFDVKCDFTGMKTRIYIPSSLSADSISNWTLLYLAKTIA